MLDIGNIQESTSNKLTPSLLIYLFGYGSKRASPTPGMGGIGRYRDRSVACGLHHRHFHTWKETINFHVQFALAYIGYIFCFHGSCFLVPCLMRHIKSSTPFRFDCVGSVSAVCPFVCLIYVSCPFLLGCLTMNKHLIQRHITSTPSPAHEPSHSVASNVAHLGRSRFQRIDHCGTYSQERVDQDQQ